MQAKRTLVKSPPELWAELSDPAALARHLGELGEIRIVRTEPERSVEWEAAQISGTVLIEPSGWGTKVTLTATRADGSSSRSPADTPEIVPESTSMPQPTPMPEQRLEVTPMPEQRLEATPTLEPEVVNVTEPLPPEPMPELQPGASEITGPGEPAPAAEVAANEITAEPEPALEPEQAAEPVEPEAANVMEPHAEPIPELQPGAIELVPEPRLGLFARLFRRHRSRRAHEPVTEFEPVSDREPVEGFETVDEQEPVGEFEGPVEAACLAVDQAAPEEPMYEQPDPAMPDAPPPSAEVTIEPEEPAPDTFPTPDMGAGLAAQSPPQATEPPDMPAELAAQSPPQATEPPDISAELAEAEQFADAQEAATEDVTAVLTSVLDRLGAAHHRPFSRA